MKKSLAIACASALAVVGFAGTAAADTGGVANENARSCTLTLGGDFASPGAMIQYLKVRTEGTAGNPKAIVDAYPNSFDNVGDLIAQKCE
jgi:hypothetical protein